MANFRFLCSLACYKASVCDNRQNVRLEYSSLEQLDIIIICYIVIKRRHCHLLQLLHLHHIRLSMHETKYSDLQMESVRRGDRDTVGGWYSPRRGRVEDHSDQSYDNSGNESSANR